MKRGLLANKFDDTRFGKLMTVISSSCLLRHGFSLRREKVTSFRSLNIQNRSEQKLILDTMS